MATVTVTTRQDRAVQLACARYNLRAGTSLTPVEFALMRINSWINELMNDEEQIERTTKAELYQAATQDDKDAVDAILDKYRS